MHSHCHQYVGLSTNGSKCDNKSVALFCLKLAIHALLATTLVAGALAQVSVLTEHNDIARTGQNVNETVLTPSNVNATKFGKLFSQTLVGGTHAQPLYVPNVTIPGKGPHNVVYVATVADYVYAFDADTNGGIAAKPLWSVLLTNISAPTGPYTVNTGVTSTPVIDPATNTMYLTSNEYLGSAALFRIHALDITTGAEKFGGPYLIQASVPGTGSGSSGGVLTFDPTYLRQRPALLLLNGVIYLAFGSVSDNGPWHGWLMSYNAATLKQIAVFCASPNGSGAGIWMSGSGPAAEVNDPNKPYGRMFLATGNGDYTASSPYTSSMDYGMSVLNMDLTGGVPTVQDVFTPYNEALLDSQDGDLGSGGPILLPPFTEASGGTLNALAQVGKSGDVYLLNRNKLGGFNASGDQITQSVQTPEGGGNNWGYGVWGSPAYWNQRLYVGGTRPGTKSALLAFTISNGRLSSSATSQSAYLFGYPGPMPTVSANGTTNGIVWVLDDSAYNVGQDVLLAYDATNLGNLLYSSNTNPTRDNPGIATSYTHPVVANGKVYVGADNVLSIYGLLGTTPTTAAPVFVTPGENFSGTLSVAITDATANAQIYYTTDGSTPTVNSTLYTGPIIISKTTTITAIASAPANLQSAAVAETYTASSSTLDPVFSLSQGAYAGTQTVKITDGSPSPSIYYTVIGAPTSAFTLYTGPITVPVTETIEAYATSPGLQPSSVVYSTYTIQPAYTFNFAQGFAQAEGPIQFNGSTDLDDIRLQLTDGGFNEAGSAFYTTVVDTSAFTTDFVFQISNPVANGLTITFQKTGAGYLGRNGSALGFAGQTNNMAIKFDIATAVGAGHNSTGLYTNGAMPTTPAIDLTGTGINLRSGDQFDCHLTYDGTDLNMTLTDVVTLASWSHSWAINIPAVIDGPHAWVGFTGATNATGSASQKITAWSWLPGQPVVPNFPAGFDTVNLISNGTSMAGTALKLTTGATNSANSTYYATPVGIKSFATDFDFAIAKATTPSLADGFTFVIQNAGPNAVGGIGGWLGYGGIKNSLAIKFDVFNNDGEGSDSTGLYLNGAAPTVPAVNLAGTGIVLGSGDSIHAHMSYDGTNLALTLTDNVTKATWSDSFAVDIPSIVGANTAYIGFTGGSGGSTAIQSILDWTYTTP
jgi:hypothetical protein